MSVPAVARWRSRRGRTSVVCGAPTPDDLGYHAYDVFDTVVGSIGVERLKGARVVEIGPGDHAPVALMFLAAGAERYWCVDRFPGDVAGPAAKQLYEALCADLAERRPALAGALRRRGIEAERFPEGYPELFEVLPCAIEELERRGLADILFSYNVLEHVSDVAAFARNSFGLLRPAGVAVHRVDFDAHDVWLDRDDPSDWLAIPDVLWGWMGSRRGAPNRLRFHEVQEHLEAAGFRVESHVLDRFDAWRMRDRPSLARRFRNMPEASLAVRTACFVCSVP